MLGLAVSEILMLKMFDLQKVGHGQGVQFLQCCPSMAKINIYKSHPWHFSTSSHCFKDIKIKNYLTSKSRSW